MKRLLLILFLFPIWCLSVCAQGFSRSVLFPQETTVGRLIETFGLGDRAVEYTVGNGTSVHQIIGALPGSNEYVRYILPHIANSFGGMPFTINDMQSEGNVLFLCGSIIVPTSFDPNPAGSFVEGFVAQVLLDSIFDGSNPNVKFCYNRVPGIVDLSKMAVRISYQDTTVVMIGKAADGHQAVVVLGSNEDRPMSVCHIGEPGEVLTDIVMGEKILAIASKYSMQNYSFGLRLANLTNVIEGYDFSDLEIVNKFVTNGMHTVGRNNHPTWHTDQATIRLALRDDWDLTLAYEGYNVIPQNRPFAQADAKVLTLFRLDVANFANIIMHDARTIEIPYSYNELFSDMLSGPGREEVLLLHRDDAATNMGGGVTVFSWSAANHRMILRQDSPVESMAVKSSNLWLGGNEGNNPWLGYQKLTGQGNSCFVEQSCPSAQVVDLQLCLPILQEIELLDFDNRWSTRRRITPGVIANEVLCSH